MTIRWLDAVLMLRMTNGKGSIKYYGMLRDGLGFSTTSGHGWTGRDFNHVALPALVEKAEADGYSIDYGPASFPVDDEVAESIRRGRFADIDVVLLAGFHDIGAPSI